MTSRDAIGALISADGSGFTLVAVMDWHGMHIVGQGDKNGKPLAKSIVASYFGNVKNSLLDRHAVLRPLCEKKLAKMATTLANHCAKRGEGFVNKAAPCEK